MEPRITLDSGALSALASGHVGLRADLRVLQRRGVQAVVPAPVLAECITGNGPRDANTNRVLRRLPVVATSEQIARRAGLLRHAARLPGSTVDALVVATAEQDGGGLIITGDTGDLRTLAESTSVLVRPLP
jgi:predicted nucleic acid-binding protein